MNRPASKIWLCLLAILIIVTFDRITKQYAVSLLTYGESVHIVNGLKLTLVYNSGAAFGILSEQSGWQRWFLILTSVLAIFGIVIWIILSKKDPLSELMPLALILGGAIGNLIDRAYFGFVVDFIHLYYGKWSWPAFNIADSAITLGVCLLILRVVRSKSDM